MDDRLFRTAMGKFATGVTVITTEVDGDVHGMTANAFMSVSLQPKLVVISISENANMLYLIKESNKFSVNILSAEQQELSQLFAGQLKENKNVLFKNLNSLPVIEDAVAQITCEVTNTYVEGDHTLFIGKVTAIEVTDKDPLLFFNGRYRSLTDETISQP